MNYRRRSPIHLLEDVLSNISEYTPREILFMMGTVIPKEYLNIINTVIMEAIEERSSDLFNRQKKVYNSILDTYVTPSILEQMQCLSDFELILFLKGMILEPELSWQETIEFVYGSLKKEKPIWFLPVDRSGAINPTTSGGISVTDTSVLIFGWGTVKSYHAVTIKEISDGAGVFNNAVQFLQPWAPNASWYYDEIRSLLDSLEFWFPEDPEFQALKDKVNFLNTYEAPSEPLSFSPRSFHG